MSPIFDQKKSAVEAAVTAVLAFRLFYDLFKDEPELRDADFLYCDLPPATCEYYMALNKPMLLHITQHFETGREHPQLYEAWLRHFQAISSKPYNVIAAHNSYDLHYTEYFTGVRPLYLPSLCAYAEHLGRGAPAARMRTQSSTREAHILFWIPPDFDGPTSKHITDQFQRQFSEAHGWFPADARLPLLKISSTLREKGSNNFTAAMQRAANFDLVRLHSSVRFMSVEISHYKRDR